MSNIDDLIHRYDWEDEAMLKAIVSGVSASELAQKINTVFSNEDDPERLSGLIELICDVQICRNGWVDRKYSNAFVHEIHSSDFYRRLGEKVITKRNRVHIWVLKACRYGGARYLPVVKKAYAHALLEDPMVIPTVVSDMQSIQQRTNWTLIKNLSNSKDYLHRWSVVEIFNGGCERTEMDEKKIIGILQRLSEDSNPFVAQEASWQFGEFLFKRAHLVGRPKTRAAQKNYNKRLRPFHHAMTANRPQYTFLRTQVIHSRIQSCYPPNVPQRDIVEGILMYSWQRSPLEKDYDTWLANKIMRGLKNE